MNQSSSTDAVDRSQFGPHPAPGTPYRTAGDLAGLGLAGDDSTPLARPSSTPCWCARAAGSASRSRARRTRVMVVANQKGGVGKTTTTVNMAAALAQHGLRVLVVDLDPQGNASTALSVDHHRGTPSTYDALVDGEPLAEIVQPSAEIDGLFVVPGDHRPGRRRDRAGQPGGPGEPAAQGAARAPLGRSASGEDRFDYVLIDCPPSLGLLTLNALVAGDEMLIPIQAEYYALEGLGQLLETVDMVKAHLNPGPGGLDDRAHDVRRAHPAVGRRGRGGPHALRRAGARTAIPRSVRISEAPSYGQTVMTYDPGSPGALSYLEAARRWRSGHPRPRTTPCRRRSPA